MGFFDRLFGTDDQQQPQPTQAISSSVRAAPPETIEQVHTEAFT